MTDAKKIDELAKALQELLAWAKSIEGTKVSRNITLTPNSIFTQARNALKKSGYDC